MADQPQKMLVESAVTSSSSTWMVGVGATPYSLPALVDYLRLLGPGDGERKMSAAADGSASRRVSRAVAVR